MEDLSLFKEGRLLTLALGEAFVSGPVTVEISLVLEALFSSRRGTQTPKGALPLGT
jgi:hypothetical protein